jgi:ArsR family transcriptional regulator, lead/cadmium/zinc/bismuth-responsive transcriptional repressor
VTRKPATDTGAKLRGTTRPTLKDRPLLSFAQAVKAAALFKLLGGDTRLRLLLQLVRSGETTVTDLATTLGMKMPTVSNQLLRLSDTGLLSSRRDGSNVYYRVANERVAPLLDLALCFLKGDLPGGADSEDSRS